MGGWSEWMVLFALMVAAGVGFLAFYASVPLFLLGVAALAVITLVAPSKRDANGERRIDVKGAARQPGEGGR